MHEFESGQLYYYANLNGLPFAYFIHIVGIDESNCNIKYYNIKTQEKRCTVIAKRILDCSFNASQCIARELNKNEKAKALLLGL